MALDPRRFRSFFLYAATLVLCFVAGAYLYRRWTSVPARNLRPQRLSGPVERSTQGFSLSKSEAGRTLFTIRAEQAVEYKEGGRAHLKNVNVVVFGKNGDRYDQISGKDFEYDPQTGSVI